MTEYDVKRLSLVMALYAKIEGLKAHNKICELKGDSERMYTQPDFNQVEDELNNLAYTHDLQLFGNATQPYHPYP